MRNFHCRQDSVKSADWSNCVDLVQNTKHKHTYDKHLQVFSSYFPLTKALFSALGMFFNSYQILYLHKTNIFYFNTNRICESCCKTSSEQRTNMFTFESHSVNPVLWSNDSHETPSVLAHCSKLTAMLRQSVSA